MTEFKASGKPRIAVLLDNRVEVTFTTTAGALNQGQGEHRHREGVLKAEKSEPERIPLGPA